MHWESLLYTNTLSQSSYCECFRNSAALHLQDISFEYLNSFSLTLNDLNVNSYGITNVEFRNIVLLVFLCDRINYVHCYSSFLSKTLVVSL